MITVDEKVLQQALEALESGLDVDPIFAGETIAALRAALAQPEQEPELRELLIGAAAMAVAAERKGAYQGASWVADAVLEQPEQPQEATHLRDLLKRIRQWDALDIPDSDGAYWKREIDAALEQPYAEQARRVEQETHGRMRIDPVTGDVSIGTPTEQEQEQEPVAWACFKNGELQTELVGTEADVDFWCASDEPEMEGMVKGAIFTTHPRRETEQEPDHKPDCALLRIPSKDCDCGAEQEPWVKSYCGGKPNYTAPEEPRRSAANQVKGEKIYE
jgi:hypothetical protein